MTQTTGGCLCGDIRFVATGDPIRVGVCHCIDCSKHHGAVFFAAAIFPTEAVTVTGKTRHYKGRHFCPRCGSSVFAQSGPEIELHLYAFDTPNQFEPTYEIWTDRRETWLPSFSTMQSHPTDKTAI